VYETFEVYLGPDSIEPQPQYEGTNAARLAIMATIGAGSRVRPRQMDASRIETFTRFGLNPELAFRTGEIHGVEGEYREAQSIIHKYGSEWDPTIVRFRSWKDLNEGGVSDARLAILAAGLSSPLERESATAATAILSSVTTVPAQPESDWRRRTRRFFDRRSETDRLGGVSDDVSAPPDEDGEPGVTWPWVPKNWARYSSYWLRNAINSEDPLQLLSELRFLAQVRVDLGKRSADPIVRELAFASYFRPNNDAPGKMPPDANRSASSSERPSTMVHGTWGWKGDWWYSGGDFHSYVQSKYRAGLYGGGQEFSWSGAYSARQRAKGGERFKRWADAAGKADGLGTVLAHSYGGEIVARAVNAGASVDEVVLLSAPVNAHHEEMIKHVRRIIDIRLAFDIVLTAAGADQQLSRASNIVEYRVKLPVWSHAATHDPELWRHEGIASAVGW